MLFGFELEYFVINKKNQVVVPREELSSFLDAGGILVEARGEPQKHPALALVALKLKYAVLNKAVRKAKRRLLLAPRAKVTPASLRYAQSHKKGFNPEAAPIFERFRNPVKLEHRIPGVYQAGFHVHFSQPDPYDPKRNMPFDMVYPIRLLDQEFAREIHLAGRLPGAYQIKPYGFEYRSLPATVNQKKLVKVLCKMLAPREFEMYPDNEIPDDDGDDL
jgi:hypothetical protein